MKNIFKIISTHFIILLSTTIYSQTGSLSGTITDSIGHPVIIAVIEVEKTFIATSTDANGKFKLDNIPVGNQNITVHLIGYKTLIRRVEIKSNQTTEINLSLKSDIKTLHEVEVSGIISISGMGHMDEVHDGIIYSGKKNEVIILDSLDANTAQNNPRQVLGRVPGANYSETEGSGFPSNGIGFRGLNPTQSIETNTRQNGYTVTADLYGYPESYYLPPLEAVERIEVTRGASSLQFGPQFGGVINYILKSGNKIKPFEFTTQQTFGSFGLFNSFNSVGGTYKKWNYYTYFQYKESNGWRPNSHLNQLLGFAEVEYNASDKFKVGLEYSILRNSIKMSGGLSDEQFNQDAQQSFRSRNWLNSPWNILTFTAQYKFSERTILSLKSSFNKSERNLVWRNEDGGPQTLDSINSITNSYVPREVEHEAFLSISNELRLLTNYNLAGINQTFATGLRYFQGKMKRQGGGPGSTASDFDLNLYDGGYEYDLDFTTTNIAPFIENTFRLGNRFSISPGFRYEYIRSTAKGNIPAEDSDAILNVDLSKNRFIPLAGLGGQFKTSSTTNIYSNCTQAFRPIDYSAQTPVGVSSKIDPNLKDASGYNADFGWRGTVKKFLNFDVGGFYLAYNNRIGVETIIDANGDSYTYRTNVANSIHKGAETYIEINPVKMFTDNSKIGTISFFNSFAYIDAKYVSGEFKGKSVELAPSTINRFGVTYALKGLSTTFLISSTSKSFADANNTVLSNDATVGLIPSYQILDWSASIKFKRFNIKFGVNNLSNAKYFTKRTDEYPGPGIIPSVGRSFYLGLGAKF